MTNDLTTIALTGIEHGLVYQPLNLSSEHWRLLQAAIQYY
jgi:hypothetical protein